MKSVSSLLIKLTICVLSVTQILAAKPTLTSDYKVKAEDLLSVKVFQEPELTSDAIRVEASGNITLFLLKEIPVAGRTVHEIEDDIERRLKDGFIKDPHVTVQVQFTERYFTIIGEVVLAGIYPLPNEKRMELADAIAKANGFTPNARKNRIELWREGEKKTYNFDDLLEKKDDEKKIYIRAGDKIVVPARFF